MEDVRAVAERVRGKRTWSIEEIRSAMPRMNRELVRRELEARYHRANFSTEGPTGWQGPDQANAVHWFVRGWAVCGWGILTHEVGRILHDEDFRQECPACRRAIERTKVA